MVSSWKLIMLSNVAIAMKKMGAVLSKVMRTAPFVRISVAILIKSDDGSVSSNEAEADKEQDAEGEHGSSCVSADFGRQVSLDQDDSATVHHDYFQLDEVDEVASVLTESSCEPIVRPLPSGRTVQRNDDDASFISSCITRDTQLDAGSRETSLDTGVNELFIACQRGESGIVKLILERGGVDVNKGTEDTQGVTLDRITCTKCHRTVNTEKHPEEIPIFYRRDCMVNPPLYEGFVGKNNGKVRAVCEKNFGDFYADRYKFLQTVQEDFKDHDIIYDTRTPWMPLRCKTCKYTIPLRFYIARNNNRHDLYKVKVPKCISAVRPDLLWNQVTAFISIYNEVVQKAELKHQWVIYPDQKVAVCRTCGVYINHLFAGNRLGI
eukprot:gene247-825_t